MSRTPFNLFESDQAARPDSTVFAIVRNAKSSTHLISAVSALKNVHILEADIVDYTSLEVVFATIKRREEC